MINFQDVAMLCMVYKLPKPLWNSRGKITGARRRGQIVYCPTSDAGVTLKVCDELPSSLMGCQKAFRIGPYLPIYAWCNAQDRQKRTVTFVSVTR
jgi:hypothetical protein